MSIPRAKNYDTYEKNERRVKWLDIIISFIANNATNATNSTSIKEVCSWVLRDIYKKYPSVFLKVATDVGLNIAHKMNIVEAAAMWSEANISFRAAHTIVAHLSAKFKSRLIVPMQQINTLSNIPVEPVFGSFIYRKEDNKSKIQKGETIKYWTYNICNLLEYDFERLLESFDSFPDKSFSYTIDKDGEGVVAIIGSDHGGGKSRFLIRINYLDSRSRRDRNQVEYGSRTLQFAEVDCKKDVHQVHAKISPCFENIENIKIISNQNWI